MRILSGIKPTGHLTLGNYLGALKNFKTFEEKGECYIFIADLHALTLPIDPKELRENSKSLAAFYLASGLNPKKTTLFLQSDVSAHSELNTIFQNYLYMGELSRMTQFKDKARSMKESAIGLGLFAYPVLMSADILLYDANVVPVGEDQVQHIELTRDLVNRFNKRYGKILTMPKAEVSKVTRRIMSLSDPSKKMSKSDPKGDIYLDDSFETMRKKIMSAVTDSGNEIKYDVVNKPGVSNLLTIYAGVKSISIEESEKHFKGYRYGDFKKEVADAVINELTPFIKRYQEIMASNLVNEVLTEGAKRASKVANITLKRVKHAIGLFDEK